MSDFWAFLFNEYYLSSASSVPPPVESVLCPYLLSPISGLFCFWLCCTICEILVPWPGIEPGPSTVKVLSPKPWTAREVTYVLDAHSETSACLRTEWLEQGRGPEWVLVHASYLGS